MEKESLDNLYRSVVYWWNNLSYNERKCYVKIYESGVCPVEALTEGAIIRLYLKVEKGLNHIEAMSTWSNYYLTTQHT